MKQQRKKTEACKDNSPDKCYIFRKLNGTLVDLTCGQCDHVLRHFLLCDLESCRNKSEAFWYHRKVGKEIVHLVTVEDVDFLDTENIEMHSNTVEFRDSKAIETLLMQQKSVKKLQKTQKCTGILLNLQILNLWKQ